MKLAKAEFPLILAALPAFAKGLYVFYFVMLPVFYAENFITVRGLGYIGAAFIAMVILGAVFVAKWLHALNTKLLLKATAWLSIMATLLMLAASIATSLPFLVSSYLMMGLASGTAMSGINALTASNTVKGQRFKSLARLSILTDIVRIVIPILAAATITLGNSRMAIVLVLLTTFGFLALTYQMDNLTYSARQAASVQSVIRLSKNRLFKFILTLEFLDSFSSSQLFVFIPLLFLAKGYTLESTLLLQSFVFLGYMSGRLLVGHYAAKRSGFRAIAFAEIGMAVTILLLLLVSAVGYLYILSFVLGVFSRGTSPAIKALSFDSLDEHQVTRGSALHVIAGDSGSAVAQLLFGILVAWLGVNSPFITAAILGLLIAAICLVTDSRQIPLLLGRKNQ